MTRLNLCFVGPAASVNLRRWVEWFVRRGHTCTVITIEPVADAGTVGFHQVDLTCRSVGRKLGRLLSAIHLARAVTRMKPDVVHAHYVRGLAWGLLGVPARRMIVTPWGSDVLAEQGAFREWYSRELTGCLLKRAMLITTHSAYMESRVRRLVPEQPAIARVGWGVNLERFRPGLDVTMVRRRWKIEDQQPVIFSPRLVQPLYNHDLVIKALPAVRRTVPNVLLVITEHFADAEYLRHLQRLAARLDVTDHVRFIGEANYEEMPYWFNVATAIVMVPSSDGMPNSLLETIACGAVPVLNRLPQYEELIRDEINGRYVGLHEDQLAPVLTDVLLNDRYRTTCGLANRALAESTADQAKEMARMESLYYELAGR
jgi:glycosyltransferase involved in cell wall biosynthesis